MGQAHPYQRLFKNNGEFYESSKIKNNIMAETKNDTEEKELDLEEKETDFDDLDDLDEMEDKGEKDKGDEDDEDDEAPLKKGEFKNFQKTVLDGINALKRHSMKNSPKGNIRPDRTRDDKDPYAERFDKIELSEQKRQFGYENQLSPKEVDLVFQFTKKPSAKTLQHPFVAGGLEKMRAKNDVRENTPEGASARALVVDGKKFDDLDSKDKQANFGTLQKSILSKKR